MATRTADVLETCFYKNRERYVIRYFDTPESKRYAIWVVGQWSANPELDFDDGDAADMFDRIIPPPIVSEYEQPPRAESVRALMELPAGQQERHGCAPAGFSFRMPWREWLRFLLASAIVFGLASFWLWLASLDLGGWL